MLRCSISAVAAVREACVRLGGASLLALLMASGAGAQFSPLIGIADFEAGATHACAITSGGALKCWGENGSGQLGNGTSNFTRTPVDVTGLSSGVVRVTAGGRHSCALDASGVVKCWGFNGRGQLGDGSFTSRSVPVVVTGLGAGVSAITAGYDHTCASFSAGNVKCWGYNFDGNLGNGSNTNSASPVDVIGLTGVVAIGSSGFHTCALTSGGVKCWGFNGSGQLGDGTTNNRSTPVDVLFSPGGAPLSAIDRIAVGENHTCAGVSTSTGVMCWGQNSFGQLGDGTSTNRLSPVSTTLANVVMISAGGVSTCAKSTSGGVKCWGDNSVGEIGDGSMAGVSTPSSTVARLLPTDVSGLLTDVDAISVGGAFACARLGGAIKCWGNNRFGELGDDRAPVFEDPSPSYVQVSGLNVGVNEISARGDHSCALRTGGELRCWGANHFGEIGDGTLMVRTAPVTVSGLSTGVTAVAAGSLHSCALLGDTRVQCWGYNELGGLGDGTIVNRSSPVTVLDSAGVSPMTGVSAIGAGGSHSCALMSNSGIKCWGNRSFGRLGDGLTTPISPLPVDVLASPGGPPLLGFTALAVGQNHVCGLTNSGGVKCWGRNSNGRLGDGTSTNRSIPVDVLDSGGVSPLSGIIAISAGTGQTCALTNTNGVKCWGQNGQGALGDGSNIDRALPVDVVGLSSGVFEISTGAEHSCARLGNGNVMCWGDNFFGQLGVGLVPTDQLLPVLVTGVSGIGRISAGYGETCVVSSGGGAKCWGYDQHGQLGRGGRNFALADSVQTFDAPRAVAPLTPAGDNASLAPRSDSTGRYVVFQSSAANLLGAGMDGNGGSDVFRVDRETGAALRLSVNTDGSEIGGGGAIEPAVSADGNFAVFVAPNAVMTKLWGEPKAETAKRRKQGGFGVFLRNLLQNTTQRVGQGLAMGIGTKPAIAPDGQSVVFTGTNTDPNQGAVGQDNVFKLPFLRTGNALSPMAIECVSCKSRSAIGAAVANADGASRDPVISADGRYVAFETVAKNSIDGLPSPCPGLTAEVMLRDLLRNTTQRISPPPGLAAFNCGNSGSSNPSIDWSGLVVGFESDQPLKPGSTGLVPNVFLANAGTITRISEQSSGTDANGASTQAVVSGDGQTVVFVSAATDLDGSFADTNGRADLHASRRGRSGGAERLSKSASGAEANDDANRPALNYNATLIVFDSPASNLVSGDANGQTDVFQRALPANSVLVFGAGFE